MEELFKSAKEYGFKGKETLSSLKQWLKKEHNIIVEVGEYYVFTSAYYIGSDGKPLKGKDPRRVGETDEDSLKIALYNALKFLKK